MSDALLILLLHAAGPALGAGLLIWRGRARRAEYVWYATVAGQVLVAPTLLLLAVGALVGAAIALLWKRHRDRGLPVIIALFACLELACAGPRPPGRQSTPIDTIRIVAMDLRVAARCYRSPHSVLFGPPTKSGQQGRGPGWLGVQLARDSGWAELVDADTKGFTAFWRPIQGDTLLLLAANDFLRVELRLLVSDSVAFGRAAAHSDAALERDATGRLVDLRRDWILRASRASCDSVPVRWGR